jgi:MFS family permease
MVNTTFSIAPLIERVKLVVTDPSGCWSTVSADSRDATALFKEFAVPMAVIGALVTLVGAFVSGFASFVGTGGVLLQFVFAIIMGCASGFVVAFIATKVASFVGGSVTLDRAYSWFIHASMLTFVGQLVGIVPFIGALFAFVAAIATVYWAWEGIPTMVNIPSEKRLIFLVGTVVLSMVAFLMVSIVLGSVVVGSGVVPVVSTTPQ